MFYTCRRLLVSRTALSAIGCEENLHGNNIKIKFSAEESLIFSDKDKPYKNTLNNRSLLCMIEKGILFFFPDKIMTIEAEKSIVISSSIFFFFFF